MAKKRIGFGDFFCVFCGEGIEKNADRCPKCGHLYNDSKFDAIELFGAGGIGWSEKADDPCFKQRNKKSLVGMLIGMIIVSLIICAVIYFTSEMELSQLLPIFGGVMAIIWVFWLIWLIVQFGKRKDWEGTVESKKNYQQRRTYKDDDGSRFTEMQTVYKVYFRTLGGKRKKLVSIDHSEWYDYLSQGDKIRYHGKNMNYYEKYDKSRDRMIPCASCGMMRDSREDYCGKCGCVILKAPHPVSAQQAFAHNKPSDSGAAYAIPVGRNNKTEEKSAPKFCPKCGAKAGGAFCAQCGNKLK